MRTSAPALRAASSWAITLARCGSETIGPMSVATSKGSPRTRPRVCSTKALDVVVEDLLGDVEALGRGADLAGVEEGSPGAAAGGDLHLRRDVGADDEGVLAAHLEVHPRHPLGAGGGDLLAGRDRAGEGDAIDAGVGGDRGADVAGAGEEVDHPGGQVREDARPASGSRAASAPRACRRRSCRRRAPAPPSRRAAAAGSSRARCSRRRRAGP